MMQRGISGLFCLVAGCFLLAGCSKDAAQDAVDSDANGYVCPKCNLKFYTARGVFAEVCPECKGTGIKPVVGFVCDKDGHTTLSARSHGSMACEKCQAPVAAIKLPREADLRAWGAAKKTKAQVVAK
jgi:hypothetical protein